jgi:ribosomal protein S18 acetylase RimI-like enzyme
VSTLESSAPTTRAGDNGVSTADRDTAIDVLVRAFRMDPVTRWAFPDPGTYADAFRAFAAAFAGRAFDYGSAWAVGDFTGAALWLPPGVGPDEAEVMGVFERYVPIDRLGKMFALMEQMGRHHPLEPHWYLPIIGVDPAAQGRGHGSRLLRHRTEWLDREGHVAYLESTNPANVPLYERHGFEVVATIEVADVPPVFPMVREPR